MFAVSARDIFVDLPDRALPLCSPCAPPPFYSLPLFLSSPLANASKNGPMTSLAKASMTKTPPRCNAPPQNPRSPILEIQRGGVLVTASEKGGTEQDLRAGGLAQRMQAGGAASCLRAGGRAQG